MAAFSRLPNEIISEIWGYIEEPGDVESFALVSKRVYAAGSPFVEEHNQLKREFSFCTVDSLSGASAAARFLNEILCRPRVALYVTHLSIGHFWKQWHVHVHDDGWGDAWSHGHEWNNQNHGYRWGDASPSLSDGHYANQWNNQEYDDGWGDASPSLSNGHYANQWNNNDGWGEASPSLSNGHYSNQWHDQGYHDDCGNRWPGSGHHPYSDNVMALFVEAIQKSSFVHPDLVSYWITCVKAGDENPILALLILLLPNLSTLSLTHEQSWEGPLQETIQRIAGAEKPMFLTRLVTVNFFSPLGLWSYVMDLNWLGMFAALPLVQSLHFDNVTDEQGDNEITESAYVAPASYNITEITFTDSGLRPISLFQLLETVKGLKVFSYVAPSKMFCRLEPFWIRNALLANAKHSLEYLRILPLGTQSFGFLGALRGFTALKKVEIDIRLLCRWPAFDKLADLLPISIEKLYLDTRYYVIYDIVQRIVEGVVKAKSKLIPHLKALEFRTNLGDSTIQEGRSMIGPLEEKCQKVGIELTFMRD